MYAKFLQRKINEIEKEKLKHLDHNTIGIIKLDGVSFKSFTKEMQTPFDRILRTAIERTLIQLCQKIDGCFLGYTNSDEMFVFIKEKKDKKFYLNGDVKDIISYVSGYASMYFNLNLEEEIYQAEQNGIDSFYMKEDLNIYKKKLYTSIFHVRIFAINPKHLNYYLSLIQQSHYKKAIQFIAETQFTHKERLNKSTKDLIKLLKEQDIYLEDYDFNYLYGTICEKKGFWNEIHKNYSDVKWRFIDTPIYNRNSQNE